MTITRFSVALALASTLGLFAQPAVSEELSVATFVPPQHHTNTGMFKWFGDEIEKRSGGSLTMRVNARSVHQVMRAIVPSMIQAGGGKVVNIASGTFYYGPPGLSHYTASKGAVIALTRCHARELGDKNIQVNAIAPGLTESEGVKANDGFDMARAPTIATRSIKREMLPEDLLGTLIYLASQDSNFVTGQTLNVDGGKVNV